MPEVKEYRYQSTTHYDIELAGDSLYKRAYPTECTIKQIVIECIYEVEEKCWHNKIKIKHNCAWDAVYTDSGFRSQVTEIIQNMIMKPTELFEKRIMDDLAEFTIDFTEAGMQYHNCATMETGDWVTDWVVKNNGR